MSFKTDLLSLTESFRKQNIDYAICGAVALAIHGFVRATPGIDVIVASHSINDAKDIAASLEFHPSMTAEDISRRLECQSQLLELCLWLGTAKFV